MSRTSDPTRRPSRRTPAPDSPAPQAATPISTAEVLQRLATDPAQVQPHEADHLQRTVGNQAVGRLVAPGPLVQRDPVNVKDDSTFHNKDKHIIGKEKRSSQGSRKETEEMLGQTTEQAAQAIHDAMTQGLPALKAFERVTFAMAGHDGGELRTAYRNIAGRDIRRDFDSAFSSQPGPYARDYLDGCLFNNGLPTLRGRVALAMRLVDSSASMAKTPGQVGGKIMPKVVGKLGDMDRVLQLIEAAEPAERKTVWNDTALMGFLSKIDDKMHRRIELLVNVDSAKENLEKATTAGGSTAAESQALAESRDQQLADMLLTRIKALPGSVKIKDIAETVKKKVTGTGYTRGSMGNIKFDAKKFMDDLLDWKASAREEDIAWVQQPTSHFMMTMKRVPTNWLTGVDKDERKFLLDFIGKLDPQGKALSGSDTQKENVSGALERQKQYVNRGPERGWLKTRIPRLIADKKWRQLESEIKLLSADQRKQILNDYSANPETAMQMLEEDLKAAGFNKEERASISAMFVTEFGDIGGQYAELKELVSPNARTTHGKRAMALVNPKKWTKVSKTFSGKIIGEQAYKIILKLEENEFVLLRNDKKLLEEIKKNCEDKTWQNILDAMGMKDENDQVDEADSRTMVHQGMLDAEGNPKRWALMLDDTIEDFKVMKNSGKSKSGGKGGKKKVGVGRDKAQLYRLGVRIQNAAKLVVRNERAATPEEWMQKVMDELATLNADKLEYLKNSVPEVWFALKENRPIPLDVRMKRAKYEGFGVGSKRKVDRQKLAWTFKDVQGRQLLDEWSNLQDLRDLHGQAEEVEKQISAANENDRPALVEQLANLYLAMQKFTLGINEARRKDFKNIGVGAEDRLKLEQMVTDRIADATEDDFEVQQILDDLNLTADDYMRAKMKGIDALEMQRYLDTTRQWHLFSTKGSQLGEGTRNVKGNITSTERKLDPKQKQIAENRSQGVEGLSDQQQEELTDIRDKGGKSTKEALKDRTLLEARFRDMQARLKKYATAIFKALVSAIIFAIITATTFGAGAPLHIGLHIALEFGFTALQAAFQYYVLGEKDLKKVAVDFAMNLLGATARILTGNLAMAMQLSVLHPDSLLPGADWLARPIAKQLGGMAQEIFMFLPKEMVAQIMHEKPIEDVVEEGEDSIADNAVDQLLVGQAKGFIKKLVVGGIKEGILQGDAFIQGEPVVKEKPTQKSFGQAYNDRLVGGANEEEQQGQWSRYQKQYTKGAKKDLFKAFTMKDKLTEEAEKKQRKDEMKSMRKEEKNPNFKAVKEKIERNLPAYRTKKGEPLLRQFAEDSISSMQVLSFDDDQKDALEKLIHLQPGMIERELGGSTVFQLLAINLRPYHDLIVAGTKTLPQLLEEKTVSAAQIKMLTPMEKTHLGLYFGLSLIGVKLLIGEGAPVMGRGRQPQSGPPQRGLPPVPVNK